MNLELSIQTFLEKIAVDPIRQCNQHINHCISENCLFPSGEKTTPVEITINIYLIKIILQRIRLLVTEHSVTPTIKCFLESSSISGKGSSVLPPPPLFSGDDGDGLLPAAAVTGVRAAADSRLVSDLLELSGLWGADDVTEILLGLFSNLMYNINDKICQNKNMVIVVIYTCYHSYLIIWFLHTIYFIESDQGPEACTCNIMFYCCSGNGRQSLVNMLERIKRRQKCCLAHNFL